MQVKETRIIRVFQITSRVSLGRLVNATCHATIRALVFPKMGLNLILFGSVPGTVSCNRVAASLEGWVTFSQSS